MPLDVRAIGCDFLTATGRKYLRGPRGTGLLYARGTQQGGRGDALDQLEPGMLDNWGASWTAREEYTLASGARRCVRPDLSFRARRGHRKIGC
eukprot:3090759-Pyramimonas_sp.AAC.1